MSEGHVKGHSESHARDAWEFARWQDHHYRQYLRMSCACFERLECKLKPHLQRLDTNFKVCLERRCVGGKHFNPACHKHDVKGHCNGVANVFCSGMQGIQASRLGHLQNDVQGICGGAETVKAAFAKQGFPNCLGAINGTCIRFKNPQYCMRRISTALGRAPTQLMFRQCVTTVAILGIYAVVMQVALMTNGSCGAVSYSATPDL
mmetsp:Transcript_27055/g.80240  ORF Transcript_27055/g.80240 Transcript_27055/m.80240 type:complete len:205 (-) Transcript_27055:714-1328(-)